MSYMQGEEKYWNWHSKEFLYLLIVSMLFGFILCLVATFLFTPFFSPKYKYESDFFLLEEFKKME